MACYVYGDHLGSTSAIADEAEYRVGNVTQYYPFGSYRPGSGAHAVTDRGFTGHRHTDALGLIYMNARYYLKPNDKL